MKVSGITWQQAQLQFEQAGLPSSRAQVWRYLRAYGVRPRRYTRKRVRLNPGCVAACITSMIQKGEN